jgi:hypothetical protein
LLTQSELKIFLKLKEDHILKADKNRVLRAIFKLKRERERNRGKYTKRSFKICIYNITRALTLRLLMSCIYGVPILDVSRSHTTTQHSR